MAAPDRFPLDAIRTDGWFERVGETVGSFRALCDILGESFFAFSLITGARITALTVDRRNPDGTLVDFVTGGVEEDEASLQDAQRLTLADFRRRLVSALVADEPSRPPPERATDTETLQLYIGVRYLLLAPLYGYSLLEMHIRDGVADLEVVHDGIAKSFELEAFRRQIRLHVRQELARASQATRGRGAIDLAAVDLAEQAAEAQDHRRVIELLGSWPAPLTIFLRTPEGQALNPTARRSITLALGLLGSACVSVGDGTQGEEVLRLAIQYAGDSEIAGDTYARLGAALQVGGRSGEAIGVLRRAGNLDAPPEKVWPLLSQALLARGYWLAAYAAVLEGKDRGIDDPSLLKVEQMVEEKLGPALAAFRNQLEKESAEKASI
jgi:hypothetical protein